MKNIDSDLIRGNIDTIILKTMLNEDKYGLDIIKEVEQRSNGTYELKQPTLYSCLKRLENQQLISSYWLNSDIGGRRHYYKLTDKGRDFYNKKQEEWAKSKFVIDNLLSNFNYEEYRLVKKDDYEKELAEKAAVANAETNAYEETTADEFAEDETNDEIIEETLEETTFKENEASDFPALDENIDEEFSFEQDEEIQNEEFDTENVSEDYNSEDEDDYEDDKPVYVSDNNLEPEFEDNDDEDDEILANEDVSYDMPDQTQNESNILNMLRRQNNEEINTYEGDKKSYASQIRSIYDDVKYVQDDMIFGNSPDEDEVDQKIKEFEDAAEKLNSFECEGEDFDKTEDEPFEEFENEEPEESDDEILETASDDEFDFSEENETTNDSLEDIFSSSEDELDGDIYAENVSFDETDEIEDPEPESYNSLESSSNQTFFDSQDDETDFEFEKPQETSAEEFDFETDDNQQPFEEEFDNTFDAFDYEENQNRKFNKEAYDRTFVNVTKEPSFEEETATPVFDSDIDSIISKNAASFSNKPTNNFFEKKYSSESYKNKLANLTTYSKLADETNFESESQKPIDADDLETLTLNFEKEGIKLKSHKRITSFEEPEKTYLLSTKINLVKSLILFFGYAFVLSAMFIIFENSALKLMEGFSLKWFAFGLIPFAVVLLYNLTLYLISPYKKVPARFASRIMLFLSVIVTVQLLLITYCVNLQLGFYSFTQVGYNHLLWIIPVVISFGPIISNLIYLALFKTDKFKV